MKLSLIGKNDHNGNKENTEPHKLPEKMLGTKVSDKMHP